MQRFDPNQLRIRRRDAGLSRAQLAYAVGRSYFTVRDYESGHHRCTPSIPALLRIARVLDCRVEDFFADVPEPVGALHTDEDEQALPQLPSGSWGDGDAREGAAHSGGAA